MRVKLLINNVDLTSVMLAEEWTIDDNEGSDIDVLNITLDDQTNIINIPRDVDVIIEDATDSTTRFFGGIVTEVEYESLGIGRLVRVTSLDWTIILERSTVSKEYDNTTDQAIIQDMFTEAGVTEIITTSATVDVGRTIDRISFSGETLRAAMEAIVRITGFTWQVDADKKLHYHAEAVTYQIFQFSDNPDNTGTFPYYDAKRVQLSAGFNSVEVHGGKVLSGDVTEVFSNDGVETKFKADKINRAPSTNTDMIIVEKNTGTDGTPIWTGQAVRAEFEGTFAGDVEWNALLRSLEWATAPSNFANNSFRIKGRYQMPVVGIAQDVAVKNSQTREYKKILYEPDIDDVDLATDLAFAFLKENGPKERVHLKTTKDGLEVCNNILVTSTALGLTNVPFLIHQLTIRLLGSTVAEYGVTLMKGVRGGSHSYAHILQELKHRVGRLGMTVRPSEEAKVLMRFVTKNIAMEAVITTQAHGDANGKYYCEQSDVVRNFVTNPIFFTNITNDWTQVNSGNHTISQTRNIDHDFIDDDKFPHTFPIDFSKVRSTSALRQFISNSSGAGISYTGTLPLTTIVAKASTAYAIQAQVIISLITGGAKVNLRVRWLNSSRVLISASTATSATVSGDPATIKVEVTSPSLTAYAEIRLEVETLAANQGIEAIWSKIQLEEKATISSYIDGFTSPSAHWRGTEHRSISAKGEKGIFAGYFKAS